MRLFIVGGLGTSRSLKYELSRQNLSGSLICETEVSGTIDAVEYTDETDDADAVDLRRSHIASLEDAILPLFMFLLGRRTTTGCSVGAGRGTLVFFSGCSGVDLEISRRGPEERSRKTESGPGSS